VGERMFGLETEYALAVRGVGSAAVSVDKAVEDLLRLAGETLVHLPDLHRQHGRFLANGSCLYLDAGLHLELATPECLDPWDVVRFQKAGDLILGRLASALPGRSPTIAKAEFFRCNVDYSFPSRATWGCHESYLHRGNPGALRDQLIPHLVSRIVYTGAGGWNPLGSGLEFTISPRVSYLEEIASLESTQKRGIYHTKDEPLSGHGYHRLHLLCGESLCSETASWLKVGATALVVAMIEAGLRPGSEVQLLDPLAAMNAFARDPQCKAKAWGRHGRGLTAIEIQRCYLAMAEEQAAERYMPSWAGEVCRKWREILDELERGAPASVARTLDWAMKRALYGEYLRGRGSSWEEVAAWSHITGSLRHALQKTVYKDRLAPVRVVFGERSPVKGEVERLGPFLLEKGLQWDKVGDFVTLREELLESDWRFGQVGGDGVFEGLDRQGVLRHHIPGVERIEEALDVPPAGGRARLRGEEVRRLAGNEERFYCAWDLIEDFEDCKRLELSDPFSTEGCWIEYAEEMADLLIARSAGTRRRLSSIMPELRYRPITQAGPGSRG
jgi:proteasome accessory factor A